MFVKKKKSLNARLITLKVGRTEFAIEEGGRL